jgi:hypothetical protein
MNELFYFAFADLMLRVEYNKDANSLRYASHRRMTSGERMIVEQYLLISVATKTEYYEREPSQFFYLGLEARLLKAFNSFHLNGAPQHHGESEKEVSAVVEGLINQSMQNYYFEQIGDAILAMRREFTNGAAQARVAPFCRRMEKLVAAYNHYSEQKISVVEVIPSEFHRHLGLPVQHRACEQSLVEDGSD